MAANIVHEVLDDRDRTNLNNLIVNLDNRLYEKEEALKTSIKDLTSRHEELKTYSETNINNLTNDKISHGEIVKIFYDGLGTDDNAANVPLSAQLGGILYNRTGDNSSLIKHANDDIKKETTRATNAETGLDNRLKTVEGDVNTFLSNADLTENAIDTLKEIQTYIDSDKNAAAQMTANIAANKKAIDDEVARATGIESNLNTAVQARVLKASIVDDLTTAESVKVLSANQGVVLKGLCDNLNTAVQARVLKASIADNLTTDDSAKVLSAKQGVALKGLYDSVAQDVASAKNDITTTNQAVQERVLKASIVDDLKTEDKLKVLSANQGVVLKGLYDGIEQNITSAQSSITTLTTMVQERVPKASIVDSVEDNLGEGGEFKVLSAKQGVELNKLITNLSNTVSALTARVAALEGSSNSTNDSKGTETS
nr:MAG TPA: hypothetical protein [Caudoviricetes sp.]